jgi:glyoxalase family protein
MASSVHGIHHVTCITGDAQENLDFYVALRSMRLVKKSVNQQTRRDIYVCKSDNDSVFALSTG